LLHFHIILQQKNRKSKSEIKVIRKKAGNCLFFKSLLLKHAKKEVDFWQNLL
jgi:hypothetical protein